MQFSTFVLAALSMGSAIASPVVGNFPFDNARKAVSEAKTNIQQQLVQINILSNNRSPNTETVTNIQNSLLAIGQSMNGLIVPVTALNQAGSAPLSKEQLAAVPQFQSDFQNILVNIDLIGKRVTSSNLNKASIAQVKPQLQWTLATVGPVSQPIISFINVYAPKYATYKTWTPYLVNIQALIIVVLGPIAVALGIDISIL
ncbi:hypothetical protein E0Z10_g4888 [Xylaria hypoxylon]|uniref:Uncharacterized protein n=1 Tax=Xylaria hypoxylon TaxID=37992 RepID=A0A4Z0YK33_9PEZI|nr:hypothetical protein E0Z10_g4888 [Xylaria hypoxylon]